MDFQNKEFYDGILKVGRKSFGTELGNEKVVFKNIYVEEEKLGYSYVNRGEAENIISLLNLLKKTKIHLDNVTIITPYKAQRNCVKIRKLKSTFQVFMVIKENKKKIIIAD